jgi:hypothetical protein
MIPRDIQFTKSKLHLSNSLSLSPFNSHSKCHTQRRYLAYILYRQIRCIGSFLAYPIIYQMDTPGLPPCLLSRQSRLTLSSPTPADRRMIIDCLNLPFDPLDVPGERSAGELVLFRAKKSQTFKRRMSPIHFPMQRTDPVQRSRPKQEPQLMTTRYIGSAVT